MLMMSFCLLSSLTISVINVNIVAAAAACNVPHAARRAHNKCKVSSHTHTRPKGDGVNFDTPRCPPARSIIVAPAACNLRETCNFFTLFSWLIVEKLQRRFSSYRRAASPACRLRQAV